MKILMINVVCGIGSTGRICTDLAQVLEAQGHEVKIAYGRGEVPQPYQKWAVRVGTDLDVSLHGLQARVLDNVGFASRRVTEKFVQWIQEYDPDLIHLHNIHGYYLNLEVLFQYLKKAKKPVVWTLHDCWAFTGHCAYFSAAGCNKWKEHCHHCPQKNTYPASMLKDNSRQNYDRKKAAFLGMPNLVLTTPSDWLASMVGQSFLAEYPIHRIYNGIDLEKFQPRSSNFREQYGLTDQKIILGVSSVWDQRKGLADFVELSNHIGDEYRIVLVGLTEKQKQGLPSNIIAISKTDNVEKLVEIYSAADVFVNPSREETMGLTTAEALACGTPVIVYDQTAVPEVPDENCGIVVECRPEEIKKALDRLEQCGFSAEGCRKRAALFEKEMQYEKMVCLYKDRINR
jgi:glycosyltransferase involved in cell wall biosynthesis